MAKLDRKDVKIFAENSKETLITEFRTEDSQGSTASFSRDPDVIQNANYSQGWVNNTNNLNTKIYGEDLNAVNYVLSYLLKYLYENGIAEWKSTTTYYQNSICKVNNALYLSLQDDNIGNNPTSTVSYWKPIPLENVSIENSGNGLSIVKDVTDNVIKFKTISVTGYGEITDNGDQLNIDIAGGGGGGSGVVDAYWGQIKGTLSNQTDLVSALGAKQDTITVNAPLNIDVDNKISIPKATTLKSGYLDVDDFNTFNGKQDALTGFTHTYNSNDNEATIEPSAMTSNIGSNDYPITNLTASNITGTSVRVDTISRNSGTDITVNDTLKVGGDIYGNKLIAYDGSTGYIEFQANQNQYRCESGKRHNFVMGADTIASIGYLDSNTNGLIMSGSIQASKNNTYNIGSGAYRFKNIYTSQLGDGSYYTDKTFIDSAFVANLQEKPGTSGITLNGALIGGGSKSASLGTTTNPIAGLNVNYAYINNKLNVSTIKNKYTEIDSIEFLNQTTTGHYINYNAGTNNSNYGTHVFKSGGGVKFAIFGNVVKSYVHLNPEGSWNLGESNNRWQTVYAVTVNQSSDIRLKENIKDYEESAIEKIEKLKPVTFNFKEDNNKTKKLGLIAQELREEEPLCVLGEETEDEYLGIDSYALTVFCLKAIKELNAKVNALEKEVAELKGQTK